ncbi:MAG: hypothetical protein HY537_10405 [Deltaproteobacteria bacterium]|nr:hypothetical protein [Deltaproteobacteria bacterium]
MRIQSQLLILAVFVLHFSSEAQARRFGRARWQGSDDSGQSVQHVQSEPQPPASEPVIERPTSSTQAQEQQLPSTQAPEQPLPSTPVEQPSPIVERSVAEPEPPAAPSPKECGKRKAKVYGFSSNNKQSLSGSADEVGTNKDPVRFIFVMNEANQPETIQVTENPPYSFDFPKLHTPLSIQDKEYENVKAFPALQVGDTIEWNSPPAGELGVCSIGIQDAKLVQAGEERLRRYQDLRTKNKRTLDQITDLINKGRSYGTDGKEYYEFARKYFMELSRNKPTAEELSRARDLFSDAEAPLSLARLADRYEVERLAAASGKTVDKIYSMNKRELLNLAKATIAKGKMDAHEDMFVLDLLRREGAAKNGEYDDLMKDMVRKAVTVAQKDESNENLRALDIKMSRLSTLTPNAENIRFLGGLLGEIKPFFDVQAAQSGIQYDLNRKWEEMRGLVVDFVETIERKQSALSYGVRL